VATLGMSEVEREAVERLQRDVIEPSMTNLVLLDFWAEWCGPCKQLSPILDKIAADYADKAVKLVKIDVDQDKLIASQFQIQSIPTVYAFFKGQPVADLTNYRSEGQLKRVIDQLLTQLGVKGEAAEQQAEIEPLIAMGEGVLADGDAPRAVSIFQQIHDMAPDNPTVIGGLARALLAAGQADEARALLDGAPVEVANHADVSRARAALELIEAAPEIDNSEIEARIAANPDDLDALYDLAGAKMAGGDRDAAADILLDIVGRDRDWNEGAARQRLLQLIEAQGLEDPWARTQRRRLSALLFT
jgi:putative thioredoxin